MRDRLRQVWLALTGKLHENDAKSLDEANLRLISTIRGMDQHIFNMSQKTSWEGMRPIFAELTIDVDRRMQVESGRIKNLLIPEIKKAYTE